MSALRQIDDVREMTELEMQMDNAFGVVRMIEEAVKDAMTSIDRQNPFDLLCALAEINKRAVNECLPIALIAQAEFVKEAIKNSQEEMK